MAKRELSANDIMEAFARALAEEVAEISEASSPSAAFSIMLAFVAVQSKAMHALFPELDDEKENAAGGTATNS